jgi:predicted transposase/invertase (TIGR01784 family)
MAKQVYDALFRKGFSTPEAVKDLAMNVLPPAYREAVKNWRAAIVKESYVERKLSRRFTDLLVRFESETDQSIYVYFLVDHKSSPDRYVSFKMLRYVTAVWTSVTETELRQKKLPEVIPVVLYHGRRKWRYPLEIENLIDRVYTSGEIPPHIPRFRPIFVDLNSIRDEEIAGSARAVMTLIMLKYIQQRFNEKIVDVLLQVTRFAEVGRPELRELVSAFFEALAETKSEEEIELFVAKAEEYNYTEIQEEMMTWAQQLRKEGKIAGKQEGMQEGIKVGVNEGKLEDKQEILIMQLSQKFELNDGDTRLIHETTNLRALDEALKKILTADTKEEVLGKLD